MLIDKNIETKIYRNVELRLCDAEYDEVFEHEAFVLLNLPETILSHPGNYGGKNYHFYRTKVFELKKKA